MNIHAPSPSLLPHICSSCGMRDSDPTYHRTPVATVSPRRAIEESTERLAVALDETRRETEEGLRAVARRTDPSTSWEAARSVTGIRESQEEVLDVFRQAKYGVGGMTDEEAWGLYRGRQSVSGFRTRRSELVARGLLRDTGERRRGSTGRRMIVWAAA